MAMPKAGRQSAAKRRVHIVREDRWKLAVLVVDDDPTMRTALVSLLNDEGYVTLQASDGADALDILRDVHVPLVVLLDWMMPILDGLTLLQMVAADPMLSSQHAYIFSSAAFPAGLQQVAAQTQHMQVDVLVKPFDVDVLLAKIDQAVAHLERAHKDSRGA